MTSLQLYMQGAVFEPPPEFNGFSKLESAYIGATLI
jgi:hypothetical protein